MRDISGVLKKLMSNIEIIPAIMPRDFADLKSKVARVAPFVSYVQLDIMDGDFVPEKTWPYFGEIMDFKKLQREEMGLPEWEKINYEIDLMVSSPDRDVFEWVTAGASRVILHLESHPNIKNIIEQLYQRYGRFGENETAPEIGLAIGVETPLSKVEPFIPLVNFIQQMGIENIGYQGEPFSEKVIARIKELRKKYPRIIISVDGGVDADSAPRLVEAGVTRLVSGSYIFNAVDIKEAIDTLKMV